MLKYVLAGEFWEHARRIIWPPEIEFRSIVLTENNEAVKLMVGG